MYDLTVLSSGSRKANELKTGDLAQIMDIANSHNRDIVLKIYGGIVSLTDPEATWTDGVGQFLVMPLLPGTTVTLTTRI